MNIIQEKGLVQIQWIFIVILTICGNYQLMILRLTNNNEAKIGSSTQKLFNWHAKIEGMSEKNLTKRNN